MGGDEVMIVAGVGCRRGCSADEILAVVREAAGNVRVDAIATMVGKAGEPGIVAAASALGIPVLAVAETAMREAEPRCVTSSEVVRRHVGLTSVAEAAALAAAGVGSSLLVARVVRGRATCAISGRRGTP